MASLTKTLAIELAESGVNVNAIAPGVFSTDMSAPMVKDTLRGEEIADAHADASLWEAARSGGAGDFSGVGGGGFVTGEVLAVDGGYLASGVNV